MSKVYASLAAIMILSISSLVTLVNSSFSQEPQNSWFRVIGREYLNTASNLDLDEKGNVYVTGTLADTYPQNPHPFPYDTYIAKLDANGNIEWFKIITADSYSFRGYGISLDNRGNVFVTGSINEYRNGTLYYDAFIAKLTCGGDLEWFMRLDSNKTEWGIDIVLDETENIYVTGWTRDTQSDAFVAKFASNGSLNWFLNFGGEKTDSGRSIKLDSTGNIYLLGYTESYGVGSYDTFIAKIGPNGSLIWFETIGGQDYDSGSDLELKENDLYIVGRTRSYGAGFDDAFVANMDSDGNIKWFKTIGGTKNEYAFSVTLGEEVYIAGKTDSYGADEYANVFISKLNTQGNLEWFRTISSCGSSSASIQYWRDNVYVTGDTRFGFDKYTSPPNEIFVARFGVDYLSEYEPEDLYWASYVDWSPLLIDPHLPKIDSPSPASSFYSPAYTFLAANSSTFVPSFSNSYLENCLALRRVSILSPLNGSTVHGNVTIAFSVVEKGLDGISLYIDSSPQNLTSRNHYIWDTTKVKDGTFSVTIKAKGTDGKTSQASMNLIVDNTLPNVSISNPTSGAILNGNINITFSASDGHLDKVYIQIDTTTFDVTDQTSYIWNSTKVEDGPHTITIRAIDLAGNERSETIVVNTNNMALKNQQSYQQGRQEGYQSGHQEGQTIGIALGVAMGVLVGFAVTFVLMRRRT